MILIHSKEDVEDTTEAVIDWLDYYGAAWARVNGEDLMASSRLRFSLAEETLLLDGHELPTERVRAVWYRRGGAYKIALPAVASALRHKLHDYLRAEAQVFRASIPGLFPHAAHVDHPAAIGLNKLDTLRLARQAGLAVPATLVANCRADVLAFAAACSGRIIAKSICESNEFTIEGEHFVINTQQIRAEELPETFYLTLFQEELEKEYELRIFCLDGDVYGMAIFSQLDQKTKVDFRNYNMSRPNRVVPYAVPAAVHTKINHLLASLGLTNGSVDMVRTVAGEYVFLEVNPTGQFGMVSEPCNYYLEQRMAEFLLKKAHENPHTR